MNPLERRRKKLIEPRIQWRFALVFLTTSALAALTQALVVSFLLMRVADQLPNDGVELKSELSNILAGSLLVTVLVLLPVTLAVGIRSTHKIVGPLYRFRVYLTELVEGAAPQPCRIRKDDELADLCELLNRATEPIRRAQSARAALPQREAA
jgi:nitrogen fixation/metabolism regulation signal transduction histidine kinase